jgi:hypothetical protein
VPTPFVVTTLFVLTTLNNAGQLVAVDKSEWPTLGGGPIFLSESGCMVGRGKMVNPERYVCQGFRSAPSAQWMPSNEGAVEPPPSPDHASLSVRPPPPVTQSPPAVVSPKAMPQAPGESEVPPAKPAEIESKGEQPKPRKVAQQPRYERQAMFEGNPLSGLFNW